LNYTTKQKREGSSFVQGESVTVKIVLVKGQVRYFTLKAMF